MKYGSVGVASSFNRFIVGGKRSMSCGAKLFFIKKFILHFSKTGVLVPCDVHLPHILTIFPHEVSTTGGPFQAEPIFSVGIAVVQALSDSVANHRVALNRQQAPELCAIL